MIEKVINIQNGADDYEQEIVEVIGDNFTFDEARHLYKLDGKPLTGVTTILGVLAKPLTQWAANCAVDHLKKVGKKLKGGIVS